MRVRASLQGVVFRWLMLCSRLLHLYCYTACLFPFNSFSFCFKYFKAFIQHSHLKHYVLMKNWPSLAVNLTWTLKLGGHWSLRCREFCRQSQCASLSCFLPQLLVFLYQEMCLLWHVLCPLIHVESNTLFGKHLWFEFCLCICKQSPVYLGAMTQS